MIPRFARGQRLMVFPLAGKLPEEGVVMRVEPRSGLPAAVAVRFPEGGPPIWYDEDDERLYPVPVAQEDDPSSTERRPTMIYRSLSVQGVLAQVPGLPPDTTGEIGKGSGSSA